MSHHTVGSAPLSPIPSILRSLNRDPSPILHQVGVHERDLQSPGLALPYEEAVHLLTRSAAASERDDFGLLLGRQFQIPFLGVVGNMAGAASSVRDAVKAIIENFHLHDSGAVITMGESSRLTSLGYRATAFQPSSLVPTYDMCLAALCQTMRDFCGAGWAPTKVELSRPLPADPTGYRDIFRAPVLFGAKTNAIYFANHWLDEAVEKTPIYPGHANVPGRYRLFSGHPGELAFIVRRYLLQQPTLGSVNASAAAETLGIHERKMRRTLQDEGISFRELLGDARRSLSAQCLKDTALPIGDIAVILGYSSTDAFDHAFRRWYGISPKSWRGRYQHASGAHAVTMLQ